MDKCTSCGGRIDDCNESQVVCPWCGEPDYWPKLQDDSSEFELDDVDWDWDG